MDLSKRAEIDAAPLGTREINLKIRELMADGHGTIVVHNPMGKHSLGVGILNRLRLEFEGSLGYFACGLIDGPNVQIQGRVGWSCAENMMAGTVVIEKNAGSSFGAALRGGDLVCKGDAGGRTGIDMKGGTILVGERTGPFSGFMMQRGRMIVLGDAGKNLGDSMYDGTIYVGGKITSLGVDAVPGGADRPGCNLAPSQTRPLWTRGPKRSREYAEGRCRQAVVELRQPRTGRKEDRAIAAPIRKGVEAALCRHR